MVHVVPENRMKSLDESFKVKFCPKLRKFSRDGTYHFVTLRKVCHRNMGVNWLEILLEHLGTDDS